MVRRRARMLALVALALAALGVLVVVAFVRDGTDPASARAGGDPQRVTIHMDDFRFAPQVVVARAGTLVLELENRGRLGHAFHVRREGRLWVEEPRVYPGERRTVRRRFEPGDYRFFDPLANFEELGMWGRLSVR